MEMRPWSLTWICLTAVLLITPATAICPPNCTCDNDDLQVRCERAELDVIPITLKPNIQLLVVHQSKIKTLDPNSLFWYKELRHVNLSKNLITTVSGQTFKAQKQLAELHLDHNKISNITPATFVGLKNLEVLSLRNNTIERIGGKVFGSLTQLQSLDLSENRIEILEEEALSGLSHLTVLYLRDNRLTVIPASNFALVPKLAELSVGANRFTQITNVDFQALQSLLNLDVSELNLENGLNSTSFEGLNGLRTLKLEHCGLTSVPSESLSPLTSLEELYLSRNLMEEVLSEAFQGNRQLRSLYISGSPRLTHIQKDCLAPNLEIQKVIITLNPKLTYLAEGAFHFLRSLTTLDLHGNNLQFIPEKTASWRDIKHLQLYDNPIACNCSSSWLRTHILESNNTDITGVKCATPSKLSNVLLKDTTLLDLACGMDPTTYGIVIGVVVFGIVVLISCVVLMVLYSQHGSCLHRLLKGHGLRGGGSGYDHPCQPDCQGYIMTPHKPVPVTEL